MTNTQVTAKGLDYLTPGTLLTDLDDAPPSFRSLARGFPALLQLLEMGAELPQWRAEAKRRKLRSVRVFNLAIEFCEYLRSIASLYGIDDSLFILSRRWQLFERQDLSEIKRVQLSFYDRESGQVQKKVLSKRDYDNLLRSYERDVKQSEKELVRRLVEAPEWTQLALFTKKHLTAQEFRRRQKEFGGEKDS